MREAAAGMFEMNSARRRFLVFLLIVAAAATTSAAPVTIRSIQIRPEALFNPTESRRGAFYRWANLLHVQTRVALIRRFLLFKEGDELNAAKLGETERNLRRLDFLKSVSISAGTELDGQVDVTVLTQDAWTTNVNGDFSNDGGKATYDFDVTQEDLFGKGSELELHLDTGVERASNTIEFIDPAFFGPYWNLDVALSQNSDGEEQRLQITRPLFSFTTAWTLDFLADHDLKNSRYFRSGAVAARYRQRHRQVAPAWGYVLSSDESRSSRLIVGLDLLDDEFSPLGETPGGDVPDDRHFKFVQIGYDREQFHFLKLDFVNHDSREEDFNLGTHQSVHLGFSPSRRGAGATFRLQGEQSIGHEFSERCFVLGSLSESVRSGTNRNQVVSGNLRLVSRFSTRYPESFVARLRFDEGRHLDRDVQFLADGQNGLRAYPDYALEGNRRLILNMEHRLFLGRELLQLFSPGLALFVDSGAAVRDRGIRLGDFRSDAGVGLRIGISRLDSALLRFDVAWAIDSSPLNHRGVIFSISTSQAF